MQKFTWDSKTQSLKNAWTNQKVDNSDYVVPSVSAKTGMIYTTHKESGDYQVLGLDWNTGEIKARWAFPDDSRLWNTFSGDVQWFEDGDFLLCGLFGIKRLNVGDGK